MSTDRNSDQYQTDGDELEDIFQSVLNDDGLNPTNVDQNNITYEISKSNVLNIHQQQLQNKQSNMNKTIQLIEALGGIDQILTDYLTSNNEFLLNESQLQQISNILNSKHKHEASKKTDSNSSTGDNGKHETHIILENSQKAKETTKQLSYSFSRSNTYLHCILNNETASKTIEWIKSKTVMGTGAILAFIWVLWGYIILDINEWTVPYGIYKLILWFLFTTYSVLLVLSINRTVIKISMKQFTFWLKLVSGIQVGVSSFLLRYVLIKDRDINAIAVLADIFIKLSGMLLIACFCSIDGIQISRRAKIYSGISISLIYSIQAIAHTLDVDEDLYQQTTIYIIGNQGFSVLSIYSSAFRVLSIFLWKQTILSIMKNGESVNIRVSPYVDWTD